jgi:hypothetical protein
MSNILFPQKVEISNIFSPSNSSNIKHTLPQKVEIQNILSPSKS